MINRYILSRLVLLVMLLPVTSYPFKDKASIADSLKKELAIASVGQKTNLYTELARVYSNFNPDSALRYASIALEHSRKQNDQKQECEALRIMAMLNSKTDKRYLAFNYITRSLDLAQRIGDSVQIAKIYLTMGQIYSTDNKHEKAGELFQKALEIGRKKDNAELIVRAMVEKAGIKIRGRKFEESIEINKEALTEADKRGYASQNQIITGNIGLAYYYLKDQPKAIHYYKIAAALNEKSGDDVNLMIGLNNIGELFLRSNQYDSSIYYTRKALRLNIRIPTHLRESYKNLFLSFSATGRTDSAFTYYNKFETQTGILFDESSGRKLLEQQAKFDAQLKEEQIRRLNIANELKENRIRLLSAGILLASLFTAAIFITYRQKNATLRSLLDKNIEIATLRKEKEILNYTEEDKSLNRTGLFTPKDEPYLREENKNGKVIALKKDKYVSSNLSDILKEKLRKNIRYQLEVNKVFMSRDLTLKSLAGIVNSNYTYVSQVINEEYGNNFNAVVNEYRVNEVRQLYLDPSNKDMSVEEMAERVGFNSVESFNRVFKKITGLTPGYYKKNVLKL